MKYLLWLLKAAIFLTLFAFALNNRDTVTLNLLFGHALSLPLVLVVLGSFALGSLFGIVVMVPRWWHHRRSAHKAQKQARQAEATLAAGNPPAAANTPPAVPPDAERHMTDPSITYSSS